MPFEKRNGKLVYVVTPENAWEGFQNLVKFNPGAVSHEFRETKSGDVLERVYVEVPANKQSDILEALLLENQRLSALVNRNPFARQYAPDGTDVATGKKTRVKKVKDEFIAAADAKLTSDPDSLTAEEVKVLLAYKYKHPSSEKRAQLQAMREKMEKAAAKKK